MVGHQKCLTVQKSRDIIPDAHATNLSGEKIDFPPAKAAVRPYHSPDALKHPFILVANPDLIEPTLLSRRGASVATPHVSPTSRTSVILFTRVIVEEGLAR